MIGKTYYRPVPKIDHKNDTKEFVPEEVMLTKKRNTFYWGNEQCHPSWLIEKALVFFETKEECQNQCYQFNYEKGYIKVDANNIHLYYKFMDNESVCEFGNKDISLFRIHSKRHLQIIELLNIDIKILDQYLKTCIHAYYFGVKDTLKPIDDYITDIKNSDAYKSYIAKAS